MILIDSPNLKHYFTSGKDRVFLVLIDNYILLAIVFVGNFCSIFTSRMTYLFLSLFSWGLGSGSKWLIGEDIFSIHQRTAWL